jgi:hypothetical protein
MFPHTGEPEPVYVNSTGLELYWLDPELPTTLMSTGGVQAGFPSSNDAEAQFE